MTRELQGQEDPEEEELFEHYSFTAGGGQEPLRVDKFLMNLIRNATRNKIQKAARDGNIRVNEQTDPGLIRFCESVEAAHSSHGDAARIADHLAITAPPARLDSQAKYAVVARGEAEAYLRLPRDSQYREKIWDHAAGLLVVTEAGGRVTDIFGNDLDFSLGYRLEKNRGVVATNTPVHENVLGSIKALGINGFRKDT